MNGWQRLIMRSQYGDDYYLPEDLPALYEEGARHGINSLFLFGWWDTGMDNGDGIRFDPMEGKEDTIQSFRLLLETAKSADIPVSWGA